MRKVLLTVGILAATSLSGQFSPLTTVAFAKDQAKQDMTSLKGIPSIKPVNISAKKKTSLNLYMTAKGAHKYMQKHKDVLLIDVRTPEETMFIGMPKTAAKNVPFMFVDSSKYSQKKKRYAMKRNPNFIKDADTFIKSKNLDEFSTIILMCRSGGRSSKAVNALAEAGYDNIYTIIDGFEGDKDKNKQRTVNGWKNAGLPWSYKIAPEKRYNQSVKVAQNVAVK